MANSYCTMFSIGSSTHYYVSWWSGGHPRAKLDCPKTLQELVLISWKKTVLPKIAGYPTLILIQFLYVHQKVSKPPKLMFYCIKFSTNFTDNNKEFKKNQNKLYIERLNKIGCKVLKRSNPNYFGNLNISIPRHMQIVIVQNKIQTYLNQTSSNYTKMNSLIINHEPKVSIFLSKIVAEHLTVQSLYLK